MDLFLYLLGKSRGGGSTETINWKNIGYDEIPYDIVNDYNYSLDIEKNWDDSVTTMQNMFRDDTTIKYMPLVDTSHVTTMQSAFNGSTRLLIVPTLDMSSNLTMNNMFKNCTSLVIAPELDISNVTNLNGAFNGCINLVTVPVYNSIATTQMNGIFTGCTSLSDESLNNIMKTCINATATYTESKTLWQIGLTNVQAAKCETLSNYQDFLDAGWTTGF